ncbi:MAG: AraC family transcriptional regulator [Oceanobacter sp.]
MFRERSSISMHFACCIADSARRNGVDADALIQQAGIDPALCQRHYCDTRQPDQHLRISSEQFAALLLGYWMMADDEFLGMTASGSKHGTFALMARQAVTLKDLGAVYRHLSRFYRLFTDAFALRLEENGTEARLIMEMHQPELDPDHMFADFFLLLWHRFPGWLIGRFTPLRAVHLTIPKPAHAQEYALIFPGPVLYEQKELALVFDAELLREPVVQTQETLGVHLDNAPHVWVSKPNIFPHYTRRVKNYLDNCSDLGAADMESAAAQLHVTSRTLRRKLTQEKTSFQALKDKARQDLAIKYLNQPDMTLAQISQQLGFSDPAAFSRAFKQWMGVAPSHYRRG